jgi:hypothetical protein
MSVGGNLVVNVGANTAGLAKGMSKAGGLVKGLASSLAGLGAGLAAGGALAGLAAGAAGAAKGMFEVGQAFGEIDAIAKSAQKFGITTEAMVGLQHAAELSGVSVEELDGAMKKAARNGTSLEAIADRIAATSDPTERANIAFKELGKSGQDLIPMLAGGGAAIRDMMAEGERLAGFSGVDAAKVEEANDAISRMKLAFTGIARDLAIELAPAVEMIAVGVQKVGEWGRAAFGDVKAFAIDAFLVAEFGWNHMGEIATLAWDTIKLGALGFYNDVAFMFTDQIPAAIDWFATNSTGVMLGLLNNYLSIWINLGQNIQDLWTGVIDFISGKGFTFEATALNKGFQDVFAGLADKIPERELTEIERRLAESINAASGSLMDGLGEHMLAGRAALGGPGATAAADVAADVGGTKALADLKGPGAMQRNSAAAFSSIFSAMRGSSGDAAADTAANTKELVEEQKRATRELRRLAKQDSVQFVAGTV